MNRETTVEKKPPDNGWFAAKGGWLQLDLIDWAKLRRFRWVPIASAAVWALVVWIQIILKPRGDFPLHFELGRRLAKGVFIYKDGLDFVYPPFWALIHAPLHIFGLHAAQVIVFPLSIVAITILVLTLRRLCEQDMPLSPDASFWSATLAILLACLFLGRDLPEVGVNTALVAMTWLSIYFWTKERDVAGGIVLGMAGALKCTPLLFVAWFILKRQWKIAATALAAFAVFTLSPILVSGPGQYAHMMETWVAGVVHGLSEPDPSRGPLGEEKVENLSLRPALARYLMHLPYRHKGRPEILGDPNHPDDPPNPYYYQFLDLPVSRGCDADPLRHGGAVNLVGLAYAPQAKRSQFPGCDLGVRGSVNPHTAFLAHNLGSACCRGASRPVFDLPCRVHRPEVVTLANRGDGNLRYFLCNNEQIFLRT